MKSDCRAVLRRERFSRRREPRKSDRGTGSHQHEGETQHQPIMLSPPCGCKHCSPRTSVCCLLPSMKLVIWFAVMLVLALSPAHAAESDLALVMAIDVSGSIDSGEYRLQHEGIARAFETPAVVSAIAGGPHGAIDVTVIEWSDRHKQTTIVPWTRVSDRASAAAFAAQVRAAHRTSSGLTAIGDEIGRAHV